MAQQTKSGFTSVFGKRNFGGSHEKGSTFSRQKSFQKDPYHWISRKHQNTGVDMYIQLFQRCTSPELMGQKHTKSNGDFGPRLNGVLLKSQMMSAPLL